MVPVQQSEARRDPSIQLFEAWKVMVIFDVVVFVELVEQEPTQTKGVARETLGFRGAVQSTLCPFQETGLQVTEHQMPVEPEPHEPVEVRMSLPHWTGKIIDQNP
jgi:hypothetical protein